MHDAARRQQRLIVVELLAGEDQPLQIWMDALVVMDELLELQHR